MRPLLLSSIAWLGVLEATVGAMDTIGRLVAIAAGLGTLTMAIYQLGGWRAQMENVKHDVAAELRRYREESTRAFERFERRLDTIDQVVGRLASV